MSIARYMASRTRLSANGFLPLTSAVRNSFELPSMPKKIVRIWAFWTSFSFGFRLIRLRS